MWNGMTICKTWVMILIRLLNMKHNNCKMCSVHRRDAIQVDFQAGQIICFKISSNAHNVDVKCRSFF